MKILHFVKKEQSGLFKTTVELAKYEEKMGHHVSLRTPRENETFYGFRDDDFDIICVHSQLHPHYYKDKRPKLLFLHGEPDYGMMVKVSTQAIMDFTNICDAFIAFNPDEAKIWNSFKRTYVIQKGIDLERYKPVDTKNKKLKGRPAILYTEHWRSFRHPLHTFVALERVIKKIPTMRFYPFGCPEKEQPFWLKLVRQNKYNFFTPGVFKHQEDVVRLINMADIVVSPVFPSYGRVSLEALACNKPVIAYDTNPHADYKVKPYDPDDFAEKIIKCYEEKPNSQRAYAEKHLDAKDMASEAVKIYKRFL